MRIVETRKANKTNILFYSELTFTLPYLTLPSPYRITFVQTQEQSQTELLTYPVNPGGEMLFSSLAGNRYTYNLLRLLVTGRKVQCIRN